MSGQTQSQHKKVYVDPERIFPVTLPSSEVCLHMRVAGKPRFVKVLNETSCQLYEVECHGNGYNADDKFVAFSAPILLSEAGLFRDDKGLYTIAERTGCGRPTHVVGTNGGTMPCGSLLTTFGWTRRYFCADCEAQS
jgi:hypothetical protein